MSINLSQFVEEFIGSGRHTPVATGSIPEESVLLGVIMEAFNYHAPDYSPSALEELAFNCTVKLAISLEVKRLTPCILENFFDWCAVTGKYPPALSLARECERIAKTWPQRFRNDGSAKGETTVNKGAEIGRNDPCVCGSGKKFKKCCMGLIG